MTRHSLYINIYSPANMNMIKLSFNPNGGTSNLPSCLYQSQVDTGIGFNYHAE